MKFQKLNGAYKATRFDGQVITIEKHDDGGWVVRYEGDFDGDNTAIATTKRELVAAENHIEEFMMN